MYSFKASNCDSLITVSDEDRRLVEGKKWYVGRNGYPAKRFGSCPGQIRYLHRMIRANKYVGKQVDHINGNKCDARRENLRIVTDAQNKQNVPARGGTSKYRGVSWNGNCWVARYGRRYIGCSVDEKEANNMASAWRRNNLEYARG